MLKASIKVDSDQLRRLRKYGADVERQLPRYVGSAILRTVRAVRTGVVNAVFEDLNVQRQKLFQAGNRRRPIRETITRHGGHPVSGSVVADSDAGNDVVGSTGRFGRIPLGRFSVTQRAKRRGVSYKIRRDGGRQQISDAWVMRMRSGYVGVFKRVDGRVVQLYGPSVGHVAERRPKIKALLAGGAADILDKNVNSQIDRLIARGGS